MLNIYELLHYICLLWLSVSFEGQSHFLLPRKRVDNFATLSESSKNNDSKISMPSLGDYSIVSISFEVDAVLLAQRIL